MKSNFNSPNKVFSKLVYLDYLDRFYTNRMHYSQEEKMAAITEKMEMFERTFRPNTKNWEIRFLMVQLTKSSRLAAYNAIMKYHKEELSKVTLTDRRGERKAKGAVNSKLAFLQNCGLINRSDFEFAKYSPTNFPELTPLGRKLLDELGWIK